MLQTNGFTPVCIVKCLFKLPRLAKLFLQTWQTTDFSVGFFMVVTLEEYEMFISYDSNLCWFLTFSLGFLTANDDDLKFPDWNAIFPVKK